MNSKPNIVENQKKQNGLTDERLYSYAEAAHYLQVAPVTLRRWVWARRIPFLKIGSHVRFSKTHIEAMITEVLPTAKPGK
jgi:excisionase family DNA binding protein